VLESGNEARQIGFLTHTRVTQHVEHVHYYEPYIDCSTADPMSVSQPRPKKQTAAITITLANYPIRETLRGI